MNYLVMYLHLYIRKEKDKGMGTKTTAEILYDLEQRIVKLEQKLLKYRVLFEASYIIKEAGKEYNELRCFAGRDYPKGKCGNIIKLLEILDDV